MNQYILIHTFLTEWEKIEQKLHAIAEIPKYYGNGEDFEGLKIEKDGITYMTSTYYSGVGQESFEFDVLWDEINEPIEYFQHKYQKEIDEKNKLKAIDIEKQKK
jgi:hypothetical protein